MPKKSGDLYGRCVGLNAQGEIVHLDVERTAKGIVLAKFPAHRHPVHPTNSESVDGWKREAEVAFSLTDVEYFSEVAPDGEAEKAYVAKLAVVSAARK